MTLGIPGLFPPRRELVNYDYFDISNGVGYDIYYGFSNAGTLGTSTVSNVYSGMIHKSGIGVDVAVGAYTELLSVDFEIIFNMPKNIKGDILAQIPFGVKAVDDSGLAHMKATCSVYHFDGSTPTQMGATATSEILKDINFQIGDLTSHISTLKINQATIKHFKKGEILRFTIKISAKHDQGSVNEMIGGVGCDPQNRTDALILLEGAGGQQIINTNEPTQMAFHVPFVIDI